MNDDIKIKIENIMNDINIYQQLLSNTDYKALKYSEGVLAEEDYIDIKIKRIEWRMKINELQEELENIQQNQLIIQEDENE